MELKEKINLDKTEIHFLPFWSIVDTEMRGETSI
jgi:hypothetical protein